MNEQVFDRAGFPNYACLARKEPEMNENQKVIELLEGGIENKPLIKGINTVWIRRENYDQALAILKPCEVCGGSKKVSTCCWEKLKLTLDGWQCTKCDKYAKDAADWNTCPACQEPAELIKPLICPKCTKQFPRYMQDEFNGHVANCKNLPPNESESQEPDHIPAVGKKVEEGEFTKENFLFHYGCEWDTEEFLGWDEVWLCFEQLYGNLYARLDTANAELKTYQAGNVPVAQIIADNESMAMELEQLQDKLKSAEAEKKEMVFSFEENLNLAKNIEKQLQDKLEAQKKHHRHST